MIGILGSLKMFSQSTYNSEVYDFALFFFTAVVILPFPLDFSGIGCNWINVGLISPSIKTSFTKGLGLLKYDSE